MEDKKSDSGAITPIRNRLFPSLYLENDFPRLARSAGSPGCLILTHGWKDPVALQGGEPQEGVPVVGGVDEGVPAVEGPEEGSPDANGNGQAKKLLGFFAAGLVGLGISKGMGII